MESVYEFIANTADGVFAVDRHQAIVMWNRAAMAMTGRTAREVLGKKCYAVMRGRDGAGCAVCRKDCPLFEAGQRFEPTAAVEMAVPLSDGRDLWLNVSTVFVPSRHHDLSVLVHLFREVPARHEIDRAALELASLTSPTSSAAPPSPTLRDAHGRAADLTPREEEILHHLMHGESTETISERLFISPHTVRNHVTSILAKLEVHSRLEAVAHATARGLISLLGCALVAID